MKEILIAACYIVAALEVVLGVYFWVTNSGNEIRKVMVALSFFTGLWVFFSTFASYKPYSDHDYIYSALTYIFGILVTTSVLHLSFVFPYKLFQVDRFHVFLLYLPALIFTGQLLFTRSIVAGYSGSEIESGSIIGGPGFLIYNLFLFGQYIVALFLLAQKALRSTDFLRRLIILVIFSLLAGGLPAVISYLILPTFFGGVIVNSLFGVLLTFIWVGVTSYIVIKK